MIGYEAAKLGMQSTIIISIQFHHCLSFARLKKRPTNHHALFFTFHFSHNQGCCAILASPHHHCRPLSTVNTRNIGIWAPTHFLLPLSCHSHPVLPTASSFTTPSPLQSFQLSHLTSHLHLPHLKHHITKNHAAFHLDRRPLRRLHFLPKHFPNRGSSCLWRNCFLYTH